METLKALTKSRRNLDSESFEFQSKHIINTNKDRHSNEKSYTFLNNKVIFVEIF